MRSLLVGLLTLAAVTLVACDSATPAEGMDAGAPTDAAGSDATSPADAGATDGRVLNDAATACSSCVDPCGGCPVACPLALPACDARVMSGSQGAVNAARDAAGPGGVVCFDPVTIPGRLTANVAGQTWRLGDATLEGRLDIDADGVVVVGGRFAHATLPGAGDMWSPSLAVRDARDVCVARARFRRYAVGVAVTGARDVRLWDLDYAEGRNSALAVWPGDGAQTTQDVTLARSHIVQTFDHGPSAATGTSPIIVRGERGGALFPIPGVRVLDCDIDQGPMRRGQTMVGWFGIELKTAQACEVRGNRVHGGFALVSLPDSDECTVADNVFDLRETSIGMSGQVHPWGIELAASHRATVARNVFIGNNWGAGVAMNTGSRSARITDNVGCGIGALVYFNDQGGDHRLTGSCLRLLTAGLVRVPPTLEGTCRAGLPPRGHAYLPHRGTPSSRPRGRGPRATALLSLWSIYAPSPRTCHEPPSHGVTVGARGRHHPAERRSGGVLPGA